MKRKIVLGIVCSIISCIGIWHNLVSHSVYYAKHMPHKEGTEPILVMIMDNYYWLPEPRGIYFKDNGGVSVRKNTEAGLPVFIKSTTIINGSQKYFYIDNNEIAYIYSYNKQFNLVRSYTSETRENGIDINTIDQKKVISEIYELVQPIIDAQTAPLINLQWLFNLVYQSRFN